MRAVSSSLPEKCLHNIFEVQAGCSPDGFAITFGDETLSYRELNRRANHVAFLLREMGVGPDVLVGLYMERSVDLLVGLLGILKAGGAYVPVDPEYPRQRVEFMMADARMPVILTQRKLAETLANHESRVVYFDDLSFVGERENPRSETTFDHLAYVIYTSGSTGKPKGTMVTHRNVLRLFQSTEELYGFGAQDVWTLFHSHAFDFSVWEIWGALLYGGRLVVVPYLVSRSPGDFYELLSSERVTVLNQTPSAFHQLVHAEGYLEQPLPLSLRFIIFGGEALHPRSLKPWFERHGDEQPRLVNMYGITETTVHVTYRPLSVADMEGGSVIGVPLRDWQVHILDAQRQPVPVSTPGEMYVGGAGVARGYLHRPELTAERFIDDPWSNDPSARLYKTGDLAQRLPNGELEFLGRIDHQVKIRGFRIELGEIEACLVEAGGVQEAAVIAREDVPGDQRLAAYLVPRRGATISVPAVRAYLKEKLPPFMVPSWFMVMPQLPLNTNGKLDREALPIPTAHTTPDEEYLAPQTETEQKLAAIWTELFGREKIGIREDFFESGGHSLLGVRSGDPFVCAL